MARSSTVSESKREEFRKYLEKEGIVELITQVLVSLYEDPNRPANALGQLRNRLAGVNVEELLEENKALKQQIEDLKNQNKELEAKVVVAPEIPAEKENPTESNPEEPEPNAMDTSVETSNPSPGPSAPDQETPPAEDQ